MDNKTNAWLERPIHPALPGITNEVVIFIGLILLAFVTRFYNLGVRVMSHDESLHTYFSWLLYRGQGYQHTPMMHGPWQFHLIALSYFLFGASDFTARIPAALFSIATIWMVWYWRRYLGKWGALITGLLMLISPFMLYYGRYVREDVYAGFSGVLLLYSILRYSETGRSKYLYLVTTALVIHFLDKESSFIYALQAWLFLAIYFIARVTRKSWEDNQGLYRAFIIALAVAVIFVAFGAGIGFINRNTETLTSGETAAPANPLEGTSPSAEQTSGPSISTLLLGIAIIPLIAAATFLVRGLGWERIRQERSFDLMILIGTLVMPMAIPFPIKWLESRLHVAIPTDSASVSALTQRDFLFLGGFIVVFFAMSIAIGLFWNRNWWKYAALFWGAFTILFTTVFTNGPGFFTGLIGSLGYWLVQQGVERGSQPEYYYLLVQIPMYEYLSAIGSIVAVALGLKKIFGQNQVTIEDEDEAEPESSPAETESGSSMFGLFFGLLVWWVITSILAFTVAGERMPWLTYHMAWPLALLAGWGIGQIIETAIPRLSENRPQQNALAIVTLVVFVLAAFNTIRSLYGSTPPFQGTELVQLQATSAFLLPFITTIVSGALLTYLMKDDLVSLGMVALSLLAIITFVSSIINGALLLSLASTAGIDPTSLSSSQLRFGAAILALIGSIIGIVYLGRQPRQSVFPSLVALTILGLIAVQTVRTAFRASYIFYDDATEYLVYAHGATGVKEVISQVEELSERTAGGLNAVVAYDASAPDTGVSWPMVWYLRNFTALRSFDQPTRSLRDAIAVIVDQKNFDKIEPALGDGYYRFDYIRMWWPNQDYWNLDRSRILNAITNPDIRTGIFDIWFNRDYTRYAQATGNSSMTLTTWQPADQMRLYVRKDVAAQIWNYGVGPAQAPTTVDPYAQGTIVLSADQIFTADRYPPGLNAPRSIAAGLNDDLYVADSRNNRVLHIDADGALLQEWGTFADAATGDAPMGTFNEPWGVTVGPDGSVFVADTWNHRIQKFTEDGEPIKTWGQYGQPSPDLPESKGWFWGPRGIAADSEGRVFVADTGNKRIVVFDEDGNYITDFGSAGLDPGQFDEPVGVAIAPSGIVYVTDTWNQRIQAFTPSEDGALYLPTAQWDVNAWFGLGGNIQTLDNKPFIAVGANEHVFITDPEGYRVIEFTENGEFVRAWGAFGIGPEEIGLASGIAVDQGGFVWITDPGNNRILRFTLPE